ncbi:MAG: N-acetylmuramoyl-L-alanine amidase [Acidobacteriia bacterium]|nr:N-acetylmuramoyl-L-alanine amidase [Terriglobia bacterium]
MLHLPRGHSHSEPACGGRAPRLVVRPISLAVLLAAGLLAAESGGPNHVTAVRYWSLGDVTRIAVETDGEFQLRSDHLSNPDRIFFDLTGTRPALGRKSMTVIPVADKFVQQIRVGEQQGNITRVVLDLSGAADASTSRLENPNRLIIELRRPGEAARLEASGQKTREPAISSRRSEDAESGEAEAASRKIRETEAPIRKPVELRPFRLPPPNTAERHSRHPQEAVLVPPPGAEWFPSPSGPSVSAKLSSAMLRADPAPLLTKPSLPPPAVPTPPPAPVAPAAATTVPPPEVALPAKVNSLGDRSMIRVLGLKVGRIVLDPGHGGHDTGTIGPKGLREKDLVLDVAKKLGALIEDRLGSEVVYTRSDDTFIPLERRTEIANEAKADLFLSIHANSSPVRSAAGVETYYLSLTTSRTALDVAARENSGSQQTVWELQDLLQKIALKDKVEESREFASRIQSSLFVLSSKTDARAKDRGVKKAPFVVLIGASMPSVLAEIGFISNLHDETVMKRQDYRDRVAESLYKGVASYANTLSHFQVAQRH